MKNLEGAQKLDKLALAFVRCSWDALVIDSRSFYRPGWCLATNHVVATQATIPTFTFMHFKAYYTIPVGKVVIVPHDLCGLV